MDFAFTEDQLAIQELAVKILGDRVTDEFLRDFVVADATTDELLQARLAEAGLLGIAIPESCGGMAMGFTELCLLLEAQGRYLAPVPLYSNLVLGALPLARFGSEALQQRYLPGVATGELTLAAAICEQGLASQSVPVTATVTDTGWHLNGSCDCVLHGAEATAILVPVDCDGELNLFVVNTNQLGVERLDQAGAQPQVQLRLSDVVVDASARLGAAGQGEEILCWLEQRALTALSALQVGVAAEALRRTCEYTSERKQFGKPVGIFQAVAHRAADGYIDVEAMRATLWQAVWRLDRGLDAERQVRVAKWWACEGGHRIAHTAQHLHGGMGADLDYPIHRYFLWAKQLEFSGGGASQQLARLGKTIAGRPADMSA